MADDYNFDEMFNRAQVQTEINNAIKDDLKSQLQNEYDRLKGKSSGYIKGNLFYKIFKSKGENYCLQNQVLNRDQGFTISCDNRNIIKDDNFGYKLYDKTVKIYSYYPYDALDKMYGDLVCKTEKEEDYRTFYEVMEEHHHRKPYLDIDMVENLQQADDLIHEVKKAIRDEMLTKIPSYDHKNTLIFQSHSDIKKSFHIIINNYCFETNIQSELFYNAVKARLPKKYQINGLLDGSVYHRNANFRMYKSHKLYTTRTKELTIAYDTYNPGDVKDFQKEIWLASLITNTKTCELLKPYEQKGVKYNQAEMDDSDDIWDQVEKLIKAFPDSKNFKFRKGNQNLIRLREASCSLHERSHKSNNAYIYIKGDMLYFMCHADKRKSIPIGKIISHKKDESVDDDIYVGDRLEAQENLFKHVDKEMFKYCQGVLYSFDTETGLYLDSDIGCKHVLKKYKEYFKHYDSFHKKTVNFYNNIKFLNEIVSYIKIAALDDHWLDRTNDSSRFYLLYKDGIWDMKKRIFIKGFNSNIVFHYKINHNFPIYNKQYVDDAWLYLYSLSKDPIPMIYILHRAICADPDLKHFIFGPGDSNCGKSSFVLALQSIFGDYVGSFTAELLSYTKSSADEAAKMRPFYLLRYKRIVCSNEINMDLVLNGNAIKKTSSGGDGMIGRLHCGNETTFYPHFTIFTLLNDVPKIEPFDDGVNNRSEVLSFDYVFPLVWTEDMPLNYCPRDLTFKDRIKTPEFISGLTHLILNFDMNTFKGFNQGLKDEWFESMRSKDIAEDIFKDYLTITKDPKDCMTVSELNKIIKDNLSPKIMSVKKFKDLLKLKGCIEDRSNKDDTDFPNQTRIWRYIKVKDNSIINVVQIPHKTMNQASFNQMLELIS